MHLSRGPANNTFCQFFDEKAYKDKVRRGQLPAVMCNTYTRHNPIPFSNEAKAQTGTDEVAEGVGDSLLAHKTVGICAVWGGVVLCCVVFLARRQAGR